MRILSSNPYFIPEVQDRLRNFLPRLDNWRRAYIDKPLVGVSITYKLTQYLRLHNDYKLDEYEQEALKRPKPLDQPEKLPPIDYKDADLLQAIWQSMPNKMNYIPCKLIIRTYVFGSKNERQSLRRFMGRNPKSYDDWEKRSLVLFMDMVQAKDSQISQQESEAQEE